MTWLKIKSLAVPLLSEKGHGDNRGNNSQEPRNQPPQPGRQTEVQESLHHDLPSQCSGQGGVLAGTQQGYGKEYAGHLRSEQRRQGVVSILDFCHLVQPVAVERAGRHDENRRVNEESKIERHDVIQQVKSQRGSYSLPAPRDRPRLDQRGMEVKVVGHHRCAQHPDGNVEHLLVGQKLWSGNKAFPDFDQIWFYQENLHQVADTNRPDEGHHQGFEVSESLVLKVEDRQHIERRQADADQERDMEEQVERDGRPDHLRQIAGGDGNFTQHPQEQAGSPRIIAAAGLREVELRDDAQPRGKRLDQDRHQVGRTICASAITRSKNTWKSHVFVMLLCA